MRKQTINKEMLAYEAPALELCEVTENAGFCVSTGNPGKPGGSGNLYFDPEEGLDY